MYPFGGVRNGRKAMGMAGRCPEDEPIGDHPSIRASNSLGTSSSAAEKSAIFID